MTVGALARAACLSFWISVTASASAADDKSPKPPPTAAEPATPKSPAAEAPSGEVPKSEQAPPPETPKPAAPKPEEAPPEKQSPETKPEETPPPPAKEKKGQVRPRAKRSGLEEDSIRIAEAQRHFQAALAHYRKGRYRAAIAGLERALKADPTGKDLVYNLALVHEKLGDFDQAIAQLERYKRMEHEPEELKRADESLTRLRGARYWALRDQAKNRRAPPALPPPAEPGRLDGWVMGAAAVSVTALVVGSVLGITALARKPTLDDSTGEGTTYDDLRRQAESAHRAAVYADVGFAVSAASAAAGITLYFGRNQERSRKEREPSASSAGDVPSFGLLVQGAF